MQKSLSDRSKKRLFVSAAIAVSVLTTLLVLEGAATLYFRIQDGAFVSVKEKLHGEENYYTQTVTPTGCTWGEGLVTHPYFAYTYKRSGGCFIKSNSLGMQGEEYPLEKKPGEYVILVLGGSVADIYASSTILQRELNQKYTNGKIRKYIVLDGAVGAWHQPQPYLLFMLFANIVDAVITIDGFNEHFVFTPGAQRIEIPPLDFKGREAARSWKERLRNVGYFLDGKLFRVQKNNAILNHSHLAYLIIDRLRGRLRSVSKNSSWLEGSTVLDDGMPPFLFPNDWSPERRQEYNINQYLYYMRAMNAVARQFGIKMIHFLQPVPDLKKDLTPEEKSVKRSFGDYRAVYEMLERRFLSLKKESIDVHSLTDVFQNEHKTIYYDYIHPGPEGMEIINQRILSILEREWKDIRKETKH